MLFTFLIRQIPWSVKTFGDGFQPKGIIDHIRSELVEIESQPYDLEEWIDVVHLGLDGAARCQGNRSRWIVAFKIVWMLFFKQRKNFKRKWHPPDENGFTRHVKEQGE